MLGSVTGTMTVSMTGSVTVSVAVSHERQVLSDRLTRGLNGTFEIPLKGYPLKHHKN